METNNEKRQLNRSHFAALVVDLAKQLGEGWVVSRYKNDTPWYGELTHPELGGLSLSLDEFDARVSISGIYNDRVEGRQVWYKSSNEPSPCITVAVTRPVKAVAGEILRRLWVDYSRLRNECNKRVEEHKAHMAASKETADALSTFIGGAVYHREGDYNFDVNAYRSRDLPGLSTDIKVSGRSVTFDRLCVPAAVAEQILAVLVRNHKPNVEA